MSKPSIEDQFSVKLDDYLNGINSSCKLDNEESNQLLEIGKVLADKDFSENSKEAVFNKVQKDINMYRGDNIMKKTNKIKRMLAIAASIAVVCTIMIQTTFAQDLIGKIKASISLGHIIALQTEPHETVTYTIPDELKGKIFDKDGNPLKVFPKENAGEIYTDNGEKIDSISKDGEIVTEAQKEQDKEKKTLVVKNSDDLNKYTCFNVILPSYLPEGYKFDRAELYKDEKGTVSNSKYINLYFTNETTGKYIYMQQRFADEETAYEFSTDGEIEKVKINEIDAVIFDGKHGKNIDWETNGVLYGLSGRGEFGKSELIEIAESIRESIK